MALILSKLQTTNFSIMYEINPFLLLVLPLIFQIIFGRKAIAGTVRLRFFTVGLISFISQFVISYAAFSIVAHNMNVRSGGRAHCGMPLLGLISLEIIFFIIMLITIIIQYFIKRSYDRD